METIRQTPLAEKHIALGAKMVPFAGWNMPVQYTGIIDEHNAVRTACGIFDISHMGQFIAQGTNVTEWLNSILTNNTEKLEVGFGQYSLMLNKKGGVIDDLILYKDQENRFFIVVNASMIEKDFTWLKTHKPAHITLTNLSDDYVGLAVQGPTAPQVFAQVFKEEPLPKHNGIHRFINEEDELIVCRTGYTGEDGFEFFCPSNKGVSWFEKFIAAGAKPCGLGARDSLRLEMCYPLNGSDLSPDKTPIEAGLGFFCDLNKDFIGADILRQQKADGAQKRLCALRYTDKGAPPRAHYPVYASTGEKLGEITSGVLSPTLHQGIALAYLPQGYNTVGTLVEIDVRGKRFPAEIVKKPFFKKS